jgi:hypothetical protein
MGRVFESASVLVLRHSVPSGATGDIGNEYTIALTMNGTSVPSSVTMILTRLTRIS